MCRLDHPICSIQNPNFVCIRLILWARSVCCLLVHLFLLVLRFACRFKVVLGTARTTQIGGGVTVAKAQRSPLWCCSQAAQRRSSSNRVIPHSHRKIGSKPQRVPSETHKTMSLGSNGMDQEHLLQKIQTKHRGTNCCINCTSLSCFASSFV